MNLKLTNPVKKNNSIRNRVNYSMPDFSTDKFKYLLKPFKGSSGRGQHGKITVRHKGYLKPSKLITVDYCRDIFNTPYTVIGLVRDNFRTAPIMLLRDTNGTYRYSLYTDSVAIDQSIRTTFYFYSFRTSCGDTIPVGWVPKNTIISNLELGPGFGGKVGRSAGVYLKVLSHSYGYVEVQAPSKKKFFVSKYSLATIGRIGFIDHKLEKKGSAGVNRSRGFRPTVRGEAMNAVDHPHGGRTKGGKPRQSP